MRWTWEKFVLWMKSFLFGRAEIKRNRFFFLFCEMRRCRWHGKRCFCFSYFCAVLLHKCKTHWTDAQRNVVRRWLRQKEKEMKDLDMNCCRSRNRSEMEFSLSDLSMDEFWSNNGDNRFISRQHTANNIQLSLKTPFKYHSSRFSSRFELNSSVKALQAHYFAVLIGFVFAINQDCHWIGSTPLVGNWWWKMHAFNSLKLFIRW